MGNISGSAVLGAEHPKSAPLFATLLIEQPINSALCSQGQEQQFPPHPSLSRLHHAKRSRQDCLTTDEMIANGSMQRDEFKQRLVGGAPATAAVRRNMENDAWKGSSRKDPWLVETFRSSP